MTTIQYNLTEIEEVAQAISLQIKHKVVLFYGQMGAGKTTFIQALIKQLGFDVNVSSPTFSLVNEYSNENTKIYHFDLYRIKSLQEALDFGFEEYIDSGYTCFIEWPEKIIPFLEDFHTIHFNVQSENEREIVHDL